MESASGSSGVNPLHALRKPGFNEKRCIVRHALGYYSGLTVAGIYELSDTSFLQTPDAKVDVAGYFQHAIQACVHAHPILRTVIDGEDTEQPSFRQLSNIDTSRHLPSLDTDKLFQTQYGSEPVREANNEQAFIDTVLEEIHNTAFDKVNVTPPWRVYIVPLSTTDENRRFLIAYNYSHSHGDGSSGLAFHQTFLKALTSQESVDGTLINPSTTRSNDQDFEIETMETATNSFSALPPAVDVPTPLPISWTYLLSVILKGFLPTRTVLARWLPRWLEFRIFHRDLAEDKQQPDRWTGSPIFLHQETKSTTTSTNIKTTVQTAIHTLSIDAVTLMKTLTQCRLHNARLTGTLLQLITHALCTELFRYRLSTTFLKCSTPIDLRKLQGISATTMGVMASTVDHEIDAIAPPPLPHPSVNTNTPPTPSSSTRPISPPSSPSSSTTPISLPSKLPIATTKERFWTQARKTTETLSSKSQTLCDQPIGLLRYLNSFRSWHTDKIGQKRDTAYELSNLMSFDAHAHENAQQAVRTTTTTDGNDDNNNNKMVRLEKLIFSQPGDVTGPPVSFNVVSVKGGELVVAICWQVGALGFGEESGSVTAILDEGSTDGVVRGLDHADTLAVERQFISRVAENVRQGFSTLTQTS